MEFPVHRKDLWDIIKIIKYDNKLGDNVESYNIEVQCPYCTSIFAVPVDHYFSIKYQDLNARIENIKEKSIDPF